MNKQKIFDLLDTIEFACVVRMNKINEAKELTFVALSSIYSTYDELCENGYDEEACIAFYVAYKNYAHSFGGEVINITGHQNPMFFVKQNNGDMLLIFLSTEADMSNKNINAYFESYGGK